MYAVSNYLPWSGTVWVVQVIQGRGWDSKRGRSAKEEHYTLWKCTVKPDVQVLLINTFDGYKIHSINKRWQEMHLYGKLITNQRINEAPVISCWQSWWRSHILVDCKTTVSIIINQIHWITNLSVQNIWQKIVKSENICLYSQLRFCSKHTHI